MNDMLLKLYVKFQELKNREEGQDLVEYALVVALIAFGATAGMTSSGHRHQHRVQQCQLAAGHRNQLVSVVIQPGQAQPVRCYRGEARKKSPMRTLPSTALFESRPLESQLPAITFVRSLPD